MSDNLLKMSRKEVNRYCTENLYATMMFSSASDDYVASRCCILNALSSGFILASEAIEKIIKSLIYLETEAKTKLKKDDRHNPYLLKEELKRKKDYQLDKFDDLLKKLYDHYQSRYYDNKTSGQGASGQELDEIDKLWVYLIEILPIPEEVKYRLKFFAELCDENSRKYWNNYYWAIKDNKALKLKIKTIENKYKKVFNHLYPEAK